MGWIGCVRCQKLRCEFMAQTFELIAPVQPFCTEFRVVTKHCQMHPTTTKCTKSWVSDPMGWIGCVRYKKLRCEFMARTFELIALVQPVLHWVSCSNETLPNAPKHNETHQNMTLGSNGVDRVCSFAKNFDAISCHELLPLLHPFNPFCAKFCAVTKQTQNAPKQYETH